MSRQDERRAASAYRSANNLTCASSSGEASTSNGALGEVADGSLAEIGTAPITNGDPETGVVEVSGAKLAVVRLADRSHLGLRQALPVAW